MTLRLAMVIEGDNAGAQKAIAGTAAGVEQLGAKTRQAAAAATEMTGAAQREEAAVTTVTAATRANTAALQANAHATRLAAAQRANLVFQLNDVFVSLASGMNPAMVAIQQGSQISTIYGPGGLGKALSETGKMAAGAALRFAPLIALAGLFAVAIAGISAEIEKQSGINVSWGDTTLAVFQVVAGGVYSILKPAIDPIAGFFAQAWELVKQGTVLTFNGIVRTIVGFYETTVHLVGLLPPAFTIAAEAAAKAFMVPIQWMVDQTIGGINSIIEALNSVGANIEKVGPFTVSAELGGTAALESIAAQTEAFQQRMAEIAVTDYAGQFFDAVKTQAITNYNNRLAETEDNAGKANKGLRSLAAEGMSEVTKKAQEMAQSFAGGLKSAWTGFFSDLVKGSSTAKTAWELIASAAGNAISKISEQLLNLTTSAAFDALFGTVASGKTQGTGLIGALTGALFGAGPQLVPGYQAGVLHQGWDGHSAMPVRTVPPSVFARAPRLHSGLAPDEFPAILQTGERVIPRGGSAGGATVNNFFISTPSPRAFAESRSSVARAAGRLVGLSGRHS